MEDIMKTLRNTLIFTFIFTFLFTDSAVAQKDYTPIVKKSIFFGKSKAIRDATVVLPGIETEMKEVEANPYPIYDYDKSQIIPEKLIPENVQTHFGNSHSKGPILNFEGVDNVNGVWPADPNGDVGSNHYVQSVNNSTAIWDKSGNLIYGPVDNKSFFDAFPGPWNNLFWSDPVFIYDEQDDRWVFTSMSLNQSQSLFYEMIAVSVSPDPMGEYYCYAYQFEELNDYPKMSAWPNGYYITYNMFESATTFLHSIVTAVDKESMLVGDSVATMIQFTIATPALNVNRWSPLTADFNGTLLPENTGCQIVLPEYKIAGFPWEVNINFFELQPDWVDPENSTFDSLTQINVEGAFPFFGADAPQPGNFHDVEAVNFYMMYPLTYRNFDDYEVMVGCQTMYNGEQHFIRWYEFRKDTSDWYIYQSGNYMPDEASRYVPSISMNGQGDIAMVFTKSSLEIYPSICFTGRKSGDSLGLMTINELEIYRGLNYANNYGSQGRNRWGDYASMMVDPVNDSTFWFTSMYPKTVASAGNWSTRIAALNLSESISAPYTYAGPDTTICGYSPFLTQGIASDYSFLKWETSGDGSFSHKNELQTNYLRGNGDLENGQATLSLTANGYENGNMISDSMILYFNKFPEANAGPDDTICIMESYTCKGEVYFSQEFYWTSSGSGTFNDSTLLDAIYIPAMADTALEEVILTLHAEPLYPCTSWDEDNLSLKIYSCLGIDEFPEKFNLNVYPNPSSGLITVKAHHLKNQNSLIRIINFSGNTIFSGQISTTGNELEKQFDFSKLPGGIYYIHFINDDKSSTIEIVIQ
jgi:hypothetical protein